MSRGDHREIDGRAVIATQYKAHIGPLPDQDWFAGVEAIHPGATEIILHDYAEEQRHQRRMQERALELSTEVFSEFNRHQRSRLRVAAGMALFLATGGLALILFDKAIYGFVLLIAEIVGLAAVFLAVEVLAGEDEDS